MGVIRSMVPHTHAGIPFSLCYISLRALLRDEVTPLWHSTFIACATRHFSKSLRVMLGKRWSGREVHNSQVSNSAWKPLSTSQRERWRWGRHEEKIKILDRNLWMVYVSHVALCICLIFRWKGHLAGEFWCREQGWAPLRELRMWQFIPAVWYLCMNMLSWTKHILHRTKFGISTNIR